MIDVKNYNFTKEIKQAYEREEVVVFDGVVSPENFFSKSLKILFILKEANAPNEAESYSTIEKLNQFAKDGTIDTRWTNTFNYIAYIVYGLFNDLDWHDIPYIKKCPKVVSTLDSIAFINLKKTPGASTTKPKDIINHLEEEKYSNLIIQQISKIDPDVIIFGNTLQYIRSRLEEEHQIGERTAWNDNIIHTYKWNGKLLINAYHPAYGKFKTKSNYDSIKEAIKTEFPAKFT